MKIAIIGAGGIARKAYFPLIGCWPGIEITHIYSRTQETIDQVSYEWEFTNGTTDINRVLDSKPDAVLILSSTETHFDFCRLFLENGVDVYSEKSLTPTSQEAFELGNIADANNRILAVGFNRRYALLYRQAKELFAGRRIQFALFQKHRVGQGDKTISELYLDDIIHQIDLSRYFCGNLEAVSSAYTIENEMIAGAVSTLQIPGGGQCVIAASKMSGAWQENATLHGDGMTIRVDAFAKLTVSYHDHDEVYGTDRPGKWIRDMRERGFYGELDHFFECVKTRQKPITDAWEAGKTLELLEDLVGVAKESPK
jgi:virulence factor